jgi:DNA-binding NarL/FixJ family response regulator
MSAISLNRQSIAPDLVQALVLHSHIPRIVQGAILGAARTAFDSGLSDAAIATRLTISIRTVQTHLGHA